MWSLLFSKLDARKQCRNPGRIRVRLLRFIFQSFALFAVENLDFHVHPMSGSGCVARGVQDTLSIDFPNMLSYSALCGLTMAPWPSVSAPKGTRRL